MHYLDNVSVQHLVDLDFSDDGGTEVTEVVVARLGAPRSPAVEDLVVNRGGVGCSFQRCGASKVCSEEAETGIGGKVGIGARNRDESEREGG